MSELRREFGAYFDAIADPDAWVREQRSGGERTQYDLRTVTEREADELAALGMRLDNAVDAVNVTALRVSRLEELVAVQRAAIERLADALTVIQLREGL